MFIINIKYKVGIDIIDQYLAEHRAWLDKKYAEGKLLCSGPKNPRDGGVIIALGNDKLAVENLMQEDPFQIHGVSEYSLIEFNPVKFHPNIQDLIK